MKEPETEVLSSGNIISTQISLLHLELDKTHFIFSAPTVVNEFFFSINLAARFLKILADFNKFFEGSKWKLKFCRLMFVYDYRKILQVDRVFAFVLCSILTQNSIQ